MAEDILTQITKPPEGAAFQVRRIHTFSIPHPYCITGKHVVIASDSHGGILDVSAIEDAERRGAKCGIRGCRLSYRDHTVQKALVIVVPKVEDLNAIPGLHAYLLSIKEQATALGIEGFAFPTEEQERRAA
jgi:hypothetical protein